MASMSGGIGVLLLCEAELSRPMYEIPSGDPNAQEEAKKHKCVATKGVGRTVPLKWRDAGCVHDNLKGVFMVRCCNNSPSPHLQQEDPHALSARWSTRPESTSPGWLFGVQRIHCIRCGAIALELFVPGGNVNLVVQAVVSVGTVQPMTTL